MAYRQIGMWEILEVLQRVARGERQRAISRVTGHSRTTIRRWLRVARRVGWQPESGEPDEALAREVATRVRPVRDTVSPGERRRIPAAFSSTDTHPGSTGASHHSPSRISVASG